MLAFTVAAVVFVVLQILDIVSTHLALSVGAREKNPLIAWLQDKLGFGWVFVKIALGFAVVAIAYFLTGVLVGTFLLSALAALYLTLVVYPNFRHYFKLKG